MSNKTPMHPQTAPEGSNMTITDVKIGREEYQVPLDRDTLEALRAKWCAWVDAHPDPLLHTEASQASAMHNVLETDKLGLNGFDLLVLGIVLTARKVRYV